MADGCFVAGDWGTSHLRLFLCDADGAVLDSTTGPGVAQVKTGFPEVFESLLDTWEKSRGKLSAVLCGMVGSSIGWTAAPYVACPTIPGNIMDGCVSLRGGLVSVVPGIRCENRLRAADFIRGEETQVLGALAREPGLRHGRKLLCLPGTHTKWLLLEDGVIREFLSAPTGEVFGVLRDHSVMVRDDSRAEREIGAAAFEAGVKRCREFPGTQVLHLLFECRSRLLNGDMQAGDAAAFLSGLLIGSDVAGAVELFADTIADTTVHVVGAPQLTRLYASALLNHAHGAKCLDGGQASLAGLTRVHQVLTSRAEANAV
jgi:2-dehydro-3-deoxygalactonokinase